MKGSYSTVWQGGLDDRERTVAAREVQVRGERERERER